MNLPQQKITIVIPTKNEEKTIKEIIEKCLIFGDELIVVDGHSSDQTREIAKQAGVRILLDHKKGKGDALRTAIQNISNDIIVFIDADGSHDPNDIPKIIEPIVNNEADHVIASRMKGGSDELYGTIGEFIRLVGSQIITLGINYRFNVKLTDSQNGFRAIKTEVAKKLNLKENITSIEQEMTIKTLRAGYRISEVIGHEYARKFGESKIKISKVWFRYVYSWLKYLLFPWT